MEFSIWRNPDSKRLRKIEISLFVGDQSIDTTYMFAFPLRSLSRRLERRKHLMLKRAAIMANAQGSR